MPKPPDNYHRLLIKLSGEMLARANSFGIDAAACQELAEAIKRFIGAGFEVGLVIGGGNMFRGINFKDLNIPRSPADQMGMLATLINGIALQQTLERIGCPAKLLSAIECPKVAETYTWRQAQHYLKSGNVVIFVGGTGNPYFTTDTAAAMRASEIEADLLLKATKVDGIYTKDPIKYGDAMKYGVLTYSQMLEENLEVMDASAVALCRNNQIPIFVFNMARLKSDTPHNIVFRQDLGTYVSGA